MVAHIGATQHNIAMTEEVESILEDLRQKKPRYHPLIDGFTFTTLGPDLYYFDGFGRFGRGWSFYEPIEELISTAQSKARERLEAHEKSVFNPLCSEPPAFYVRFTENAGEKAGFVLGLHDPPTLRHIQLTCLPISTFYAYELDHSGSSDTIRRLQRGVTAR